MPPTLTFVALHRDGSLVGYDDGGVPLLRFPDDLTEAAAIALADALGVGFVLFREEVPQVEHVRAANEAYTSGLRRRWERTHGVTA